MSDNKNTDDLSPEVRAMVERGIPLHKALAMAGLKDSQK